MNNTNNSPLASTLKAYGPKFSKNEERREFTSWRTGDHPGIYNTCVFCGRKAGSHWVALDTNGNVADYKVMDAAMIAADTDDPQAVNFMGYYPAGSTCRKVLPKGWARTKKSLNW